MKFTKMEGLGNSFIVLDGPLGLSSEQVRNYCDEHETDGLLPVTAINNKLVEMKYWNTDGSPAEMCGNGLRCVARYAVENKLVEAGNFNVRTDAGPLKVHCSNDRNEPVTAQIGKVVIDENVLSLHGTPFYTADVGNPHAVTFTENVDTAPVNTQGPLVENDNHFPEKTNVEYVQVISPSKIKMRVWERGVGETKACGTGMVAAAITTAKIKGGELPIQVEVPGGIGIIDMDESGYAQLTGPATIISTRK